MATNEDILNLKYFLSDEDLLIFNHIETVGQNLNLHLSTEEKSHKIKNKTHIPKNKFYISMGILLKNDNKYMFGKRDSNTPIEPNKYSSFNGHCTENPTYTQDKEFLEELLLIGQNIERKEKRIIDISADTIYNKVYRAHPKQFIPKTYLNQIDSFKPIYGIILPDYKMMEKQSNNIYKVFIYIDGKRTFSLGLQIVNKKFNEENNIEKIELIRAKEIKLNKKHKIVDSYYLEAKENNKIYYFSENEIINKLNIFSQTVQNLFRL